MGEVMDVDWESLAAVLLDGDVRPALAIDREMIVRAFNGACEELFHRSRYEIIGKSFWELYAARPRGRAVEACLDEAVRGIRSSCEVPVVMADGRQLLLGFDLKAIGRVGATLVLATVRSVREEASQGTPRFEGDLHYDIDTAPATFGQLKHAWTGDPARDAKLVGDWCFRVFAARPTPCPTCPVRLGFEGQTQRTMVVQVRGDTNELRLLTAHSLTVTSARVSVRRFEEGILSTLATAKVDDLAQRASLSDREREVLHQLVAGRSLEEIAEQLAISQRTVKFHQSNMLAKLGADSRLDLLRLIF